MTAMPEAALAREAELCYQTVAMVTDFDAWHGEHEAVDVAQVLEVLHRNVASAQSLVVAVAERLGGRATDCASGCRNALDHAVIPDRGVWPEDTVARLGRKSVVSGKSVSVRVDLGGRRIITKKNCTKLSYDYTDHTTEYTQTQE